MGPVAFLRSRAREASDLDCMSRTRTAIRIRSRSNSARAPKTWKVRFLTIFDDGPYETIADIEYATAGWVDWRNN